MDSSWSSFHLWAITNNTALNIYVQVFAPLLVFKARTFWDLSISCLLHIVWNDKMNSVI